MSVPQHSVYRRCAVSGQCAVPRVPIHIQLLSKPSSAHQSCKRYKHHYNHPFTRLCGWKRGGGGGGLPFTRGWAYTLNFTVLSFPIHHVTVTFWLLSVLCFTLYPLPQLSLLGTSSARNVLRCCVIFSWFSPRNCIALEQHSQKSQVVYFVFALTYSPYAMLEFFFLLIFRFLIFFLQLGSWSVHFSACPDDMLYVLIPVSACIGHLETDASGWYVQGCLGTWMDYCGSTASCHHLDY